MLSTSTLRIINDFGMIASLDFEQDPHPYIRTDALTLQMWRQMGNEGSPASH
jgi:hypothetical protein